MHYHKNIVIKYITFALLFLCCVCCVTHQGYQDRMAWEHWILTFTSVLFGAPSVYYAYLASRWGEFFLCLLAVQTSALMHISETKHGLVPDCLFLIRFSKYFLSMNNFSFVLCILYLFFYHFNLLMKWPQTIAFGLLCYCFGESSSNTLFYVILNTLWQMVVFGILRLMINEW